VRGAGLAPGEVQKILLGTSQGKTDWASFSLLADKTGCSLEKNSWEQHQRGFFPQKNPRAVLVRRKTLDWLRARIVAAKSQPGFYRPECLRPWEFISLFPGILRKKGPRFGMGLKFRPGAEIFLPSLVSRNEIFLCDGRGITEKKNLIQLLKVAGKGRLLFCRSCGQAISPGKLSAFFVGNWFGTHIWLQVHCDGQHNKIWNSGFSWYETG